jgi:hypothetical protein
MNIRMPIAALALCLASGMAFAATPATPATAATPAMAATPATTAATPAAKPAVKPAKKHHAAKCKADQTMVNGKCEDKKAG